MYPLTISGKTKNIDELRRLGVMIAENLNINFFDYPNCSPHRTSYSTEIYIYYNKNNNNIYFKLFVILVLLII